MNTARIRWIALIAAVTVLALGYLSLTRTVTVLVDGQALVVASRALNVGGVLSEAGVSLGPKDSVNPSTWAFTGDGMVIAVTRATRVHLAVDGGVRVIETSEKRPAVLLAEQGLDLGEGDRLLLAGETLSLDANLPDQPVLFLELRRAVSVTVQVGDEAFEFVSSAPTLGQVLVERGIELDEADVLVPAAETKLSEGLEATVTLADQTQIALGDDAYQILTSAETAGEALAAAGFAPQGIDEASEEAAPAGGSLSLQRISEVVELTQEIIPNDTDFQEDPEAELDTLSVVQEGQTGVSAVRTRVRYQDGAEISRVAEGERVVVEPQTAITGYGTRLVLRTVVVDGIQIEYYRAVTAWTTWYSPCNSGTTNCLYGTSSGLPVQQGTIATYLNWYRELNGATVYIPGYGHATFGDNSGSNSNGREFWIDLAFSEDQVAAYGGMPWANKHVTIYFTTPIPFYIPPIWPP